MAGFLPKLPHDFYPIPWARLAIIGSMWHINCVESMVMRAQKELLLLGVQEDNIDIHYLPGSLELPFAARVLFENDPKLDAVLAFGVVLTGITSHDSMVFNSVMQGFSTVTERFNKPIINEVIGVSSIDAAIARAGDDENNKGLEAVFAASELLHWRRSFLNAKHEKTQTD